MSVKLCIVVIEAFFRALQILWNSTERHSLNSTSIFISISFPSFRSLHNDNDDDHHHSKSCLRLISIIIVSIFFLPLRSSCYNYHDHNNDHDNHYGKSCLPPALIVIIFFTFFPLFRFFHKADDQRKKRNRSTSLASILHR